MAKLFASWVPGYSTVAQNMGSPPLNWNGQNYTDVNGHREGFGVHFYLQGNQANWFHVPLPTPVIVEDQRATLGRVMILFGFPQGASLQSVHVWDGPNRILQRDGLNITGNHAGGLDPDNEGYSGGGAKFVANFRLAARLRERRPASRKDWVTTLSPVETGRVCIVPPDSAKTRSSTCAR
jgi:hypothetical protein